jgi:PTH1 family peptidyl-tRNA hydrolase
VHIIVGLGNPGKEYEDTRHNAGRVILMLIAKKCAFSDWRKDGTLGALVAEGKLGKEKCMFVLPENFMNTSGASVAPLIPSSSLKARKQALANLVVVYDDLDLPLGSFRISYNRSSGGHNGVESIIKKVKSQEFYRIRIGLSPQTPSGKTKRPKGGAEKTVKFLMNTFKDPEMAVLKKESKKIAEAIEMLFAESANKAMSIFNSN